MDQVFVDKADAILIILIACIHIEDRSFVSVVLSDLTDDIHRFVVEDRDGVIGKRSIGAIGKTELLKNFHSGAIDILELGCDQ